ncbi:MAG: bifunctional alpha,alpha-trehalose-phosphate synthase (UDP-forming)/trehalose-phosphatase [Acidobacteriota bacterium]
MGRLILVSNRLPFTLRHLGDESRLARSAGGLVAGLGPVHESSESLWIGSLGGDVDGVRRAELQKHRLVPISLPREKARRHYEGFSNGVLWPLFHYFLESVEFDPADYEAYRQVNQRFADVVAQHARPSDRIWIHDYHLMLLPSLLRQRLPDARIGFFLHIPFPASEVFRVLPVAQEILRGLLGSNVVGVHSYDYARHLATCFWRFFGSGLDGDAVQWEGGRCHIRVLPLGVDVRRHRELAASAETERRLAAWRRRVAGRKVVLGVDRLDYSKGLTQRLEAYRRLLTDDPFWRKAVVFLQLAVPTRQAIQKYGDLKRQVEQSVGEINGEFGELGRMPVHYMYRSVPTEELAALYRLADVAMVTPLRDGMNLVAKEYIASRLDDTGVLVLSEFAGAASELGEALVVNPWDLDGTVGALRRALSMEPDEMRRRMSALRRRVATHDARYWATTFLESLEECAGPAGNGRSRAEDGSWTADLVQAFAIARRPLIVLAYDGTLREFDEEPGYARPDPELLDLLQRLSSTPGLELILLSGRDRESLSGWFGGLPIHLVAEHGVFLRARGGESWDELVPGIDRSWFAAVEEAMASYVARTPGSFIERKHAGLAWHYRRAEPDLGLRQGRELAHHLTEYFANRPVRVQQGACVVEAHSQGIDKGWAYRILLRRFGAFDFILAAGDDRTDEDLFETLAPSVWSIKVGGGVSAARFRLSSPDRLRALLTDALASRLRRRPDGGSRLPRSAALGPEGRGASAGRAGLPGPLAPGDRSET